MYIYLYYSLYITYAAMNYKSVLIKMESVHILNLI